MSDDLITEDWLKEKGFLRNRPCHVHGTPNCNWSNGKIEIWNFNDTGDWLWVDYDSVSMKTKSDLQALLDWVNIEE